MSAGKVGGKAADKPAGLASAPGSVGALAVSVAATVPRTARAISSAGLLVPRRVQAHSITRLLNVEREIPIIAAMWWAGVNVSS